MFFSIAISDRRCSLTQFTYGIDFVAPVDSMRAKVQNWHIHILELISQDKSLVYPLEDFYANVVKRDEIV